MDKGTKTWWWEFPRWSDVYVEGTDQYIEKAFATRSQGNQISCPCCSCHHRYWYGRSDVRDHVICNGFVPRNDEFFGFEGMGAERETEAVEHDEPANMNDCVQELLQDTLREGPNEEAKKFLNLIEEGQQELYSGCKKMSRLAFTIRLYMYKCDHKLSDNAIVGLLEFFKEVLPDDAVLPTSMHEAKKVLKLLGLDYKRIDACPNDCMLFWGENATATTCHVCGTSRWKYNENVSNDEATEKTHKIPSKVLRYFPIKKRLQRLYMCAETAKYMTWHSNGREDNGLLQHPADGEAWKNFDKLYPTFSQEPRNVRLSLATDGFNPFNTMSIVHSTWPVILINYNLPPWLATKSEFLMLSLLIPGPLSPGNDIDVYLQPLVKDLKDLWESGLETYDASTNTRFDMHVALVSTVSDFPGYAMLSGWSTKGKTACPYCHYEIDSEWLTHSRKHCYMCHRKWLPSNHPWRNNKRNFDGNVEKRNAPIRLTGVEIEELLQGFPNDFGKKQPSLRKDENDPNPWRKFSIFFQLPYWKHCTNRHNLDVMHIEKNVFDNVIGTLLDISGKAKDHEAARRDLNVLREKKGIRWVPELELVKLDDGSEEIPTSQFWLSNDEKRLFCQTIKNAKLPQGYASNIARCVQVHERKITGYKSHDAHFMMHYLLPIAAKATLNKDVATPLIRLSNFFKCIWRKTIDPCDLNYLHSEIVETLCQFEGIFPPAFFDIMVHLPVHLVEEIALGGPVAIRCMYAIERYLRELKSDARNKGRPEASMAECFLAKECARFVARYLSQTKGPSKHVVSANEGHEFDQQPTCDENATTVEDQMTTPNQECSASKKKNRGPTKLVYAHARKLEERPPIILNSYGQPIGPTKKLTSEYSLFLGTLARNPEFLPLNYCDWPSIPEEKKDNCWQYVQKKYLIADEGKEWTFETLNGQWKAWKCKCKALYYFPYKTYEERWEKRPRTIPENIFQQLLSYWDDETIKEESRRNQVNRMQAEDMHTMGPTSFAFLREQLKQQDPDKKEPSKTKVYNQSRERKPGKSYKTTFDKTKQNIEQMDALLAQECEGSNHKDPYDEVMTKPEHSGRVRLYGKGVTKTDFKKGGKSSSYIFPQEYLQSMQSQVFDQILDANPEVQKLLEANPGVKIVLPCMSKSGSNGNSHVSGTNGNSSMEAHSNNQLVHVELNGDDVHDNEAQLM